MHPVLAVSLVVTAMGVTTASASAATLTVAPPASPAPGADVFTASGTTTPGASIHNVSIFMENLDGAAYPGCGATQQEEQGRSGAFTGFGSALVSGDTFSAPVTVNVGSAGHYRVCAYMTEGTNGPETPFQIADVAVVAPPPTVEPSSLTMTLPAAVKVAGGSGSSVTVPMSGTAGRICTFDTGRSQCQTPQGLQTHLVTEDLAKSPHAACSPTYDQESALKTPEAMVNGVPSPESVVREGGQDGDAGVHVNYYDYSHPYGDFTQSAGQQLSFWHAGSYRVCGYLTELANPLNGLDRSTITLATATGGPVTVTGGLTLDPETASLLGLVPPVVPAGSAAKIATILADGGTVASVPVSSAGTLQVLWTYKPGASRSVASAAAAVVVARGTKTVKRAGTVKLRISLTKAGKRLLKKSRKLRLTSTTVFDPAGPKKAVRSHKAFTVRH